MPSKGNQPISRQSIPFEFRNKVPRTIFDVPETSGSADYVLAA